MTEAQRRFSPPWQVDEAAASLCIRGPNGQALAYVYFEDEEAYFAKKRCKVLLQPTPAAIGLFNRSKAKKVGLFHVSPRSASISNAGSRCASRTARR